MTIHIHHAYPGIVMLIVWCFIGGETLGQIGIALVISDVIFHLIAKTLWGDPLWD
jgi:hypothetical protein